MAAAPLDSDSSSPSSSFFFKAAESDLLDGSAAAVAGRDEVEAFDFPVAEEPVDVAEPGLVASVEFVLDFPVSDEALDAG